jgi:hypothetical protein
MTTLAELADSFNTVASAVELAAQYDEGTVGSKADVERGRMARQLVDAWNAAMDAHRGAQQGAPAATGQPLPNLFEAAQKAAADQVMDAVAAPPQAPTPGPLADTLAKIAAGLQQAPAAPPAPAPAPAPLSDVRGSFDEWVALADALGRNVQDVIRQWHSSRDGIEGGWDKATDAQRAEQMAKALAYYQNKNAEPGEIDYTICYVCGSKGRELKTRSGDLFYACSKETCGFNGREGKFVNTAWDATNYTEKREKWRAGRQRAQQRGGGFARR